MLTEVMDTWGSALLRPESKVAALTGPLPHFISKEWLLHKQGTGISMSRQLQFSHLLQLQSLVPWGCFCTSVIKVWR